MRALAGLMAAAALLTLVAGHTFACSAPPPPNWNGWIGDPNIAMMLGRVDRIESHPPRRENGETVFSATAHIIALEVIQGEPSRRAIKDSGLVEIRREPGASIGPFCWIPFQHRVDDLVIVVEYSSHPQGRVQVFSTNWRHPHFAAFLERHQ